MCVGCRNLLIIWWNKFVYAGLNHANRQNILSFMSVVMCLDSLLHWLVPFFFYSGFAKLCMCVYFFSTLSTRRMTTTIAAAPAMERSKKSTKSSNLMLSWQNYSWIHASHWIEKNVRERKKKKKHTHNKQPKDEFGEFALCIRFMINLCF